MKPHMSAMYPPVRILRVAIVTMSNSVRIRCTIRIQRLWINFLNLTGCVSESLKVRTKDANADELKDADMFGCKGGCALA